MNTSPPPQPPSFVPMKTDTSPPPHASEPTWLFFIPERISPEPTTPERHASWITEAISSLKQKSGSSQHAIAKFIVEKYYYYSASNFKRILSTQLSTQLKKMTKSGELVKVKRSFKLPVMKKPKKKSVETKQSKKKKKTEAKEKEKEKTTKYNEEVEKMMRFLKYSEKIERLRQVRKPKISKKEELIRKEKANLEEWKKVAAISSVDLDLVGSLEKLMEVQHELEGVKEQTLAKIQKLEDSDNEKLWRWMQQQDDQEQMRLYQRRNEIIKSIPKFWSTAFTSDYSLRRRLNEEDKKIIKFLNSVVVEGRPDVTSRCTITLNFDENPYFENPSLTKKFRFTHKGIVEVSGTSIAWKIGKGIIAGLEEKRSEQSHTDINKSFFTWFCEDSQKKPKLRDGVANSIACDLWCYAPDYFVNAKQC